jgi:DNA-directed RNA polymerase specialized sigma24 family protein
MHHVFKSDDGRLRARNGKYADEPSQTVVWFDDTRQQELARIITKLAPRAANGSPEIALQAVSALRRRIDELEREVVTYARACAWPWADIASMLGISRSAVHRRFAEGVTERED